MSPEVVHRKISKMIKYLDDLLPYKESSFDQFVVDHYKVERLIELLVMTASDIAFHLLSKQSEPPPSSYRAGFQRLGELKILDPKITEQMALGAGLRNILAHDYEDIDYNLLHESIPAIIHDIRQFMNAVIEKIQ